MVELLPALFCTSMSEFRKKIQKLEGIEGLKAVHIDIIDGNFLPVKTITLEQLRNAYIPFEIQIHLMALEPQAYIPAAAEIGAKEFIFHAEATSLAPQVARTASTRGLKPGIAISPETRPTSVRQGIVSCEIALVMGVNPGASGQELIQSTLAKIPLIRSIKKEIKIGFDGGVKRENACLIAKQGADFVAAASALFEAKEIKEAFANLKRSLEC